MNSINANGASALTLALALTFPNMAYAQNSAQSEPNEGSPQTTPTALETGAATPVSAQDKGGLQDIVVTAQRRSENIQSVPVAITAVTSSALQVKGITDVAGIGGQAPNVTLKNTAQFGGSSAILVSYIRGIGQNDFAFNLEAGVGVYIDGVYLARNIGSNVDLLDLDRVEILKGPQGTLFGRNTIGGALNIVTRDPGKDWKFKAEATTGRYSRADFRGAIDAPLIPGLLQTSFALSTKHRTGYQRRIPYTGYTDQNPIYLLATGGAYGGQTNTNANGNPRYVETSAETNAESGNQNQTSLRAKVLFTPSDKLRIRLIGDYLNVDEEAAPFSLLDVKQGSYVALYNTCITGDPAVYAGVGALTGFGAGVANLCTSVRGNPASSTGTLPSLGSQAGTNLPYDARYVVRNANGSINPDLSYATGANFDKVESYGINSQIEYDVLTGIQLKSITAYRRLKSNFGVDTSGAPFVGLTPTFSDRENQFSEEMQVLGKVLDNRLTFVLGGYFFHEYGSHDDDVPFQGGLIQIDSPNNTYDTKSYALYLHNNIQIIPDKLGITLGARYTHEDKSFTGAQSDDNAFGLKLGTPAIVYPDPTNLFRVYPLGENLQKFNNFSYRVGAEYHFTKQIMIYGSYATAFKGGGWTTRLTVPNYDPATLARLGAPTFGPEKANTGEIGLKTELFNRRVRLNIAAFTTDYNNIQLTFVNGSSPVTANGGDGRIRGAEAELNALITPHWSLDASVGYLDAKYTRIAPGVPLTLADKFVNTPNFTAQAGTSYTLDTGVGAFVPRVDWVYTSRVYNDESNTAILSTAPHSVFNGSLTFRLANNNYEIQAGVTNIFDKRFLQSGFSNGDAVYAGTFNRPREFFLTLRVRD